MSEGGGGDFLERLAPDLSAGILLRLEDTAALVRATSVSRSWRRFVIANGLCKKFCSRIFPEISCFARVIEVGRLSSSLEVVSGGSMEFSRLESEHTVYAQLGHCILQGFLTDCIVEAIAASSTHNHSVQLIMTAIENTLHPSIGQISYWSSMGKSDPDAPETLTYRLSSKLCVVYEISLQPLQVRTDSDDLIYMSKTVRFKLGHSWCLGERSMVYDNASNETLGDGNYMWTYVSPEFSMVQGDRWQTFKLPQPVICVGGILQIELLGRVQKSYMDNLYYVCVSHVKAIGKPLSPAFDVEILDRMGNSILMYFHGAESVLEDASVAGSSRPSFSLRYRRLRRENTRRRKSRKL
ncbi:F-box protein [Apostasia shenzhenica]|uniref:F-box protein n=1 Tax=Apostasia shenzhenica TaxID=1088818 RepID=A0A2I0B4Y3_9ASPA|nr:F-box protein [Apostasia shenzhenica]